MLPAIWFPIRHTMVTDYVYSVFGLAVCLGVLIWIFAALGRDE